MLLIEAIEVAEEDQCASLVTSRMILLGKLPVAMNACVPPTGMEGLSGLTAREVRLEVLPVPVRFAVWGLLLALSVTVRVPVRVPSWVGLNVTPIEQRPPAAREDPHGLVGAVVVAKSPLAVALVIVSGVLRLFVRVMVLTLLIVPIPCEPKLMEVAERVAC